MNSAVNRDQGLDSSTLRILVPVCFFGWSRQLPYKAVSLLLDVSEVITRERYQLYRTELVDITNAVCSFQIFTLFFLTHSNLFTPPKTTVKLLVAKSVKPFFLILARHTYKSAF
jgi:hypothetical protein